MSEQRQRQTSDQFQQVDMYRVSKEAGPQTEGKHWVWRYELDGRWLFVKALTPMDLIDWQAAQKASWGEDKEYCYWRDASEAATAARFTREMAESRGLVAENRPKPWLPLQPGEEW